MAKSIVISRIATRPEDGQPAPQIALALADKNPMVLEGLRSLFATDPRLRLAVSATDGERFLDAVERVPFDVGVVGWVMPYCDGACVLDALRKRATAPRIIIYTGSADPDVPRQALALGARGFSSKSQPPQALLETVLAVAQGSMVFPFVDVRTLNEDPFARLTEREREILAALPSGLSNAELARRLGISVNTIKFHLKSLYDKLGAKNRAQAVARSMARRN
ncbi:MAG: response regulator transcription factor [Alphaproteobacteria bacterium]|nr:response regulator transcription factor [Alphaproteobacteria bacterium]